MADYGRKEGPKVAKCLKCLFDGSAWLTHVSRRRQALQRAMQKLEQLQHQKSQNENNNDYQNCLAWRLHPLHEITSHDAMQNMHGRKNQNPKKTPDQQAKYYQR